MRARPEGWIKPSRRRLNSSSAATSRLPTERSPRLTNSKRRPAIPTEWIFSHIAYGLPLLNVFPDFRQIGTRVTIAFFVASSTIYWLIYIFLRRSGTLARLWEDQVLDVSRSRVSVGTVVSLADHFHILLAFVGLFLYAVNGIHHFGDKETWIESFYTALMGFNLKGFDDFQTVTKPSVRAICALLSILNALFIGFFAAAFLKPFVIVFGHK